MESVTKYIENVLRLKVNRGKSKIGRATEIQYLGFAFYYQFQEKKYKIKVPQKALDKVMKKVRKLTSRKWGVSNSYKAQKIAEVVRGCLKLAQFLQQPEDSIRLLGTGSECVYGNIGKILKPDIEI